MPTAPLHPLEPLTAAEVERTVPTLRDAGKATASTRFVSVSLHEPAKGLVHAFPNSALPPREAFVVLFDNALNACYEAIVAIAGAAVLSWRHIPGVQPTMTVDEQVECEAAVLASPAFRDALERHYGVSDTSLVMVDIWSAGNYGTEEDRTRRLTRPLRFLRSDPTDNGYARPIEGIRPVVDLNSMEVIRAGFVDHHVWITPNHPANDVPPSAKKLAVVGGCCH